jgi:hypothetical protein
MAPAIVLGVFAGLALLNVPNFFLLAVLLGPKPPGRRGP